MLPNKQSKLPAHLPVTQKLTRVSAKQANQDALPGEPKSTPLQEKMTVPKQMRQKAAALLNERK